MINPDLERHFAKAMMATTLEVEASHVPYVVSDKTIADFISTQGK